MPDSAIRGDVAAIVVAAGSGSRYGEPKHLVELDGKALWRWSLDAFTHAGIPEIIVVGELPGAVSGGPRRRDSVRNGLDALASGPTWVLIHDAARPLVSSVLIHRVIDAALAGDADGVIPGLPVTDTIKRVERDLVISTIDRSTLVAVQTPQAFLTSVLVSAHDDTVGEDVTDDAALVELSGGSVRVVTGEPDNMKITYREDLKLAESVLRRRGL